MGTLCPEKVAVNRKNVVKELVQGKKFANQLRFLLQKPVGEDGLVSREELVAKILRSFTQSLSVLSSSSCDDDDDDQNQQQQQQQQQEAGSCMISPSSNDRRLEDSGESNKKRPGSKVKKGCYKRKKNSQTWTIVSSTMDDDYAWRKYGKKDILNAKYPRSYFRCTHKYDQGCRATKQVQRMDDDPQKFETIYIGNHTCRDMLSFPPQVISDSSDPWSVTPGHSYAISSWGTIPTTTEVKQECKEETTSTTDDLSENLSSTNLDSIMWEDLVPPFQSSDEPAAAGNMGQSLQMGSSIVYSCNKMMTMISSHNLAAMDSFDEHEFQFDEFLKAN